MTMFEGRPLRRLMLSLVDDPSCSLCPDICCPIWGVHSGCEAAARNRSSVDPRRPALLRRRSWGGAAAIDHETDQHQCRPGGAAYAKGPALARRRDWGWRGGRADLAHGWPDAYRRRLGVSLAHIGRRRDSSYGLVPFPRELRSPDSSRDGFARDGCGGPLVVGNTVAYGTTRSNRNCRRLRGLGPRQQPHSEGFTVRSPPDRIFERADRRAGESDTWSSSGSIPTHNRTATCCRCRGVPRLRREFGAFRCRPSAPWDCPYRRVFFDGTLYRSSCCGCCTG